MKYQLLIALFICALYAEKTYTLEQLKAYDTYRIKIDPSHSFKKGWPLSIQGEQLFTKGDLKTLKRFSPKADSLRQISRKQNISGTILTLTGFVGLESALPLAEVDGESVSPVPFVIGASAPLLVTGLVKINRGYNKTMDAFKQYELDLRTKYAIPMSFPEVNDTAPDSSLSELQRFEHYLARTVTLSPVATGYYFNIRTPFLCNGQTVDLSSRSAYLFLKQMPNFTPLSREEILKATRIDKTGKLMRAGGLLAMTTGGFICLGGLLSEIGGNGKSSGFYVVNGIILPTVGLSSVVMSIPITVRGGRKFNRALKTYDRELREFYRID